MVDLSERSKWLRREILLVSGGWLGEIVPLISDALRIWDIFVLAALFIPFWVVIRVTDSMMSMILGLAFDGTIPLQHQLNPKKEPKHREHLASYWPVFFFVTTVEFMCFCTIHPELFTLAVCLKTALMTALWLARRENGTFLVNSVGSKGGSGNSPAGSGSTGSGGRTATPSTGGPAVGAEGDSTTPEKETREQRWDRKLKAAGYKDDEARKAMLNQLKRAQKPDELLAKWLKEKDPEKQKAIMETVKKQEKARDERKALEEQQKATEKANDGLSIAHRINPATAGRKGNTPDKVNPADYTGNLMDIRPRSDSPAVPSEDQDSELLPEGRPGPGLRERLGLKRRESEAPTPPPAETQPPPPLLPEPIPVPPLRWEGHTRRHNPSATRQRQWGDCNMIDPSEAVFQYDGPKGAPRTQWEKDSCLGHASLELVDHYLKDAYVDYTARGQMLMDLMDHLEYGDNWRYRDKHLVQDLVKGWKTADTDERWMQLMVPYVGMGWMPQNWAWESADSRAIDDIPTTRMVKRKLDKINWLLRRKGIPHQVRRAMIRDLMSQEGAEAYHTLWQKLEEAVKDLQDFGSDIVEPKDQKAKRSLLEKIYWDKSDFGGQFVISERRLKQVIENAPPTVDKMIAIRELRKSDSEEKSTAMVTNFVEQGERVYGGRGR